MSSSSPSSARRSSRRMRPTIESLESKALLSYLTNPAPSVTQVNADTFDLRKELYGYGNYGVADHAADVLYSHESGGWSYDLSSILGSTRQVVSADFTISGVLDDHYSVTGSYFGTISTNGVTQFSGSFPYAHGAPYGTVFNNWATQVVPVTALDQSTFTINIANDSNLGGGDWIAIDYITLRVATAPIGTAAVPEPSTLTLLMTGASIVASIAWGRKQGRG